VEELQGPKTPQKVRDWMKTPPAWLEVQHADLSIFTPQKKIHDGEREAFALAIELKADAVLLDDKGALAEAKNNSCDAQNFFPLSAPTRR
jgi:predicted nucleic acid-binding protein